MARRAGSTNGAGTTGIRKRRGRKSKSAVDAPDVSASDPMEMVKKLTELEKLRFVQLDTALQNYELGIKNYEHQQQIDQKDFELRRRNRQDEISTLRHAQKVLLKEQQTMMLELGQKYDFDPRKTSIDDKTGVIQEHTGTQ